MSVVSGSVELKVPDGEMVTFTYRPEGDGSFPTVIVCQAAMGVDQQIKDLARAFADEGYCAVAPNLYHRATRNGFATTMEETAPLRVGMTDNGIVDDLKVLMDHLQSTPYVDEESIGVMGCCQGGRTSFIAASRVAGIACSVIYYGGGIMPRNDAPLNERLQTDNPIDYGEAITCPMIGFFGDSDQRIPMDTYRTFESRMREMKKDIELHLYPGADHGFLQKGGRTYHREAAKDSWARTLAFLEAHLKGARSEPAGARP